MAHPHTSAYSSGELTGVVDSPPRRRGRAPLSSLDRSNPRIEPEGALLEGEPGVHFGKYTVLERIGAGGMAEIFKCRLSGIGGFGKLVVVKRILPTNLAEPGFVNMFLDEARVAANLSHPNIVQTYEIDEIDGIPYIAMEYVRGLTFGALVEQLKGRPFNRRVAVAAKVMAGACEGLYWAHNAVDAEGDPLQLVHRDVSPHNILVSVDGTAKLADFGVAKARGRLTETRAGTLKGKFMYMAPEQFQAESEVDHRVDIFSAGVCLYWAATGRLPYRGYTELEVIHAAARGQFRPPSEWVAELPPELERLILWAMAPQPEGRCPDSHQLARALEAFTASGPYACSAQEVAQVVREFASAEERSSGGRLISRADASGPIRIRDLGLEVAAQALGLPFDPEASTGSEPASTADLRDEALFPSIEPTSERMLRDWPLWTGLALAIVATGVVVPRLMRGSASKAAVSVQKVALPTVNTPAPIEIEPEGAPVVSVASTEERDRERPMIPAPVATPAADPAAPVAEVQTKPAPSLGTERTGMVSIVSEPFALVFVDGKPWGETPIVKRALEEGSYEVELRRKGYVTETRTLIVNFDEESQLSLRLFQPAQAKR